MKYSVRSIFRKVHLWLGMLSGIVIFIVAITGCIYAFQDEIKDMFRPSLSVEATGKPFLSPEVLKEKATAYVFITPADSSNAIYGVMYNTFDKAASLGCNFNESGYTILYVNPYDGRLIHKESFNNDFFRSALAGHRSLWLPYTIGKQVIGWSVWVFVIVLLSGLILWFPKKWNRKSIGTGLKIKWKAPFTRVNYDLHNVLGFYTAVFALIIALTGLTWSFEWFSTSYYSLVTGGKEFKKWEPALSDTTQASLEANTSTLLWEQMKKEYPIGSKGTFRFDYPRTKSDAFMVCYNPSSVTYYTREYRFFDQFSLQELTGGGSYGINAKQVTLGDKLFRMSYDIHSGSIFGLPGRILAFLVSLVIASLPITGVIIWWRKKKKRKRS